MKLFLLDEVTRTIAIFDNLLEAYAQAKYLASLGHKVRFIKEGGKS